MDQIKQNLQNEIDELRKKLDQNRTLQKEADGEGLKQLADEEIERIEQQIEALTVSLNSLEAENQLEAEIDDEINPNTVVLEIRAGTGGDEAGLFAKDLHEMYCRYAEQKGWKIREISRSENNMGGFKTITSELSGKNVYNTLKNESGVHRVQRVPVTESGGRIHTSTATVALLPHLNKINIEIKPEDLEMDFYRSSGSGGQNVNKVSTAVRLTHEPTGVVVECQEERSQHKNREKAMEILKSRLFEMMRAQQVNNISELRAEQVGSAERSEKIRTYNFPQDRVTDHRVKKSWGNIGSILNGNIDEIINTTEEIY